MNTLRFAQILTTGLLGASMAILAGCATNMTSVSEKLYNDDGTPSSEFAFNNRNWVTWGSKQESGAGTMAYEGDGWNLTANGGAKGQQAGTVNLTELAGLLQLLQELQPKTIPPTP